MKIVFAMCFVGLVVCSLGGPLSSPTDKQQPSPARCCMASKFSAMLTDLATVNTDAIGMREVALDFDLQLEAVNVGVFRPGSGTTHQTRLIMDFPLGIMYTISGPDETSCVSTKISWPMPPRCVPENAVYLGSTYLGPVNALPYDGWRFNYPGTQANLTMAFTTAGCVPIVEGLDGQFGTDESANYVFLFTTYVPEIPDRAVFNIPESCTRQKG